LNCCGSACGLLRFVGRGGIAAHIKNFKSFKMLVFLKRGVRNGFRVGYLRFLNSISPSGVVATYSNPVSISFWASTGSLVALHIHSSLVDRKSADSIFT